MAPGIRDGADLKRATPIPASLTARAVLLLVCALAVIWGLAGVYLRQEYQRSLRDAESQTANLARAFEETVSRSIALLDQALEHVRDSYLRDPGRFTLDDWLRDKTVLHQISVQISVAGPTGLMLTSTVAGAPAGVSIADREHFRVHVPLAEDRLFISKPVIGRISGRLSVQFSRRMTAADGRFAGVVVASLDPTVPGVFRESSRVGEGFAMLIGRDGIIRSARPDTSAIGGTMLPPADPAMARQFEADQRAEGTETAAGPEDIASYRGVTGYPLFVAVGVSRQAAFRSYDQAWWSTVLAGLCLSLVVSAVIFITLRQWHRLIRFQSALTMTMENISQGVLMIDKRRRMPVINHRVAQLLDLPPELASPGADFDTLVRWQEEHGEFPLDVKDGQRIASMRGTGGTHPAPAFYERTRADGTVLEIRTTVLADGGAVRTFTDVTERKRIEHEMAGARDAAEAGIRARTEFLAVMSHEIRTPLNGIIGAAGLLRDMRLNPEQNEYVSIIRGSGEHLASLIQDILDFSCLDAGRVELEEIPFDPRALLKGTVAMLAEQARLKGLTLNAATAGDVPELVTGDPSRLRQVLVNLISNAVKFTDRGSVAVQTRVGHRDAGSVTLEIVVTDTGIGISPMARNKLFSAFTQEDNSISRRFGGTGLGLAICRQLVTLMHGTIDVGSTPGLGSTFRFDARFRLVPEAGVRNASGAGGLGVYENGSLRLRVEAHRTHEKSAVQTPRATSPNASWLAGAAGPAPDGLPDHDTEFSYRRFNVLLAEDNPTNRYIATRMLSRMGHAVMAVEDGALAVTAAAAADYDVILMDMMMPGVDGLAATRTIRAGEEPRCHTVIVGLTANARASDRAACEAAGMNGFVTKPVTMERLRDALEQFVARDAAVPAEPRTREVPLLDTMFLKQLAADIGPDSTSEVMRAFLEEGPERLNAIRDAMADGAIQSIRREAHALTGAARNLGLTRIGVAASSLQEMSERDVPDAACFRCLSDAFRDTLPVAADWALAHETLTPIGG